MRVGFNAAQLQRSASDPEACIWVAASAGTGKTKVLTDRVLNLLLKGSAPERILCLTFTRAAAGEMANRLQKRLSLWATMEAQDLIQELTDLTGNIPNSQTIQRARHLFIHVLDAPGGIKIQTIHSFCQSLLKRFPLEAELAPHFTVIDDQAAQEILSQAQAETLNDQGDCSILDSLEALSCIFEESTLKKITKNLISKRQNFNWLISSSKNLNRAKGLLEEFFEVSLDLSEEKLIEQSCQEKAFNYQLLLSASKTLLSGSKKDGERSQLITDWLENPQKRTENFLSYCTAFLTKDHIPRNTLATQSVLKSSPEVKDILEAEAKRLQDVCLKLKRLKVTRISWALTRLGTTIFTRYQKLKARRALLDYDDLVDHTVALLNQPEITPWILYKLDGGIDHILIDEAQDSNVQQWNVVSRLTEEFFSGLSSRSIQRTLFVVGDEKQSIYSFQGADPRVFDAKRQYFSEAIQASQQEWREVILNISFRSTKAILETVDAIFKQEHVHRSIAISKAFVPHQTHRQGHGGLVEIWPLAEADPPLNLPPWSPPIQAYASMRPERKLALSIAQQIHSWIKNKDILLSKGRPIQPQDIMILVRRRCTFMEELIRALKMLEIPVAGTDRIILTNQLVVMDLIAIGRFLLLPEDDLNLATVLKSPLIGLNEEQLFDLAYDRGQTSVWQQLKSYQGTHKQIIKALSYLEDLLSTSKFLTPYELFSHILMTLRGKEALIGRLGYEALDPLEEFMSLALAYQQNNTASLEKFLHWLDSEAIEIKRDMEGSERNEVRIMTIHGAKGLQAPIVFLPDTVQPPRRRENVEWAKVSEDITFPLWLPSQLSETFNSKSLKASLQLQIDEEYLRLLYVAMTRAEDRLYVCGWHPQRTKVQKKDRDEHVTGQGTSRKLNDKSQDSEYGSYNNDIPQKSWYALIQNAFKNSIQASEFDFEQEAFAGGSRKGLRYTCPQEITLTPAPYSPLALNNNLASFPSWIKQKPNYESSTRQFLRPSHLSDETSFFSPFNEEVKRGQLIHSLLEYLPSLPKDQRKSWGKSFIKNNSNFLTEDSDRILDLVLNIVEAPKFSLLFGPQSKAEVPIIGFLSGQPLSGKIDRLVLTEKEVLIVDYKTHRNPPRLPENIPESYLKQLNAYKSVLTEIYPCHNIQCAILWTQIPDLMKLDSL